MRSAAAETSIAVPAPSLSAASCALGLFEIAAAILTRVLPAKGNTEPRADKDLHAMFGDAAHDEGAAVHVTPCGQLNVVHGRHSHPVAMFD